MITCPRCGAENKDTAAVCRMCATALDAARPAGQRPPGSHQDIPATVLVPSPIATQPPSGGAAGGKVTCPACQAANDADWAFCQQCGTRLQGAAPQQQSWGSPTVVTPSAPPPQPQTPPQPPAGGQPAWGAPTVVTPAPDFSQPQRPQQPPPQPQPPAGGQPSWGAPTVVTQMPDLGQPSYGQPAAPQPAAPQPTSPQPAAPGQSSYGQPGGAGQQGQQPPAWGAPTVVTPMPDLGQPPSPPQPQPPAGGQPSWGAPTVVTQMPDLGQPSYGQQPPPYGAPPDEDQRYVQTVVGPLEDDINAYPQTVVGPVEEPAPPPPPAHGATAPTSGPKTADVAMPPTAAPAGDQRTIVMSSTPVAEPPKAGRLLLIMEGGEIGETYGLRPSETVIGRVDGDIKFPHDGYMSSRHARIIQRNGRFFLLDNNSRNGTFIKIHQEVELHPGDVILVGKQLFRFETEE